MADESSRKTVKVGVRVGQGPPPGYRWNIEILDAAWKEAHDLFDEDQYRHLAAQFRELAGHDDPTHSETLDLDSIEDFYELRDKGGVLGKLNARIFYFVHGSTRTLVVLAAIHKQNNGPTPVGDRVRARNRKRRYVASHETG